MSSYLDRRLRKIEARTRSPHGPWFFVFGRSDAEIQAEATAAPVGFIPITWTHSDPVPAPRWASARDLTDTEMMAVLEAHVGSLECWPKGDPDQSLRSLSDTLLDDALLAVVLDLEARP